MEDGIKEGERVSNKVTNSTGHLRATHGLDGVLTFPSSSRGNKGSV